MTVLMIVSYLSIIIMEATQVLKDRKESRENTVFITNGAKETDAQQTGARTLNPRRGRGRGKASGRRAAWGPVDERGTKGKMEGGSI